MPSIIKKTSIVPYIILVALIAMSAVLMIQTSKSESATMDELAHIPAGYGYVQHLDYRLNPEHPPLVKALAGIPLLFIDVTFPTSHKSWSEDINGQWDAGREFLYNSGNDPDTIVFWSRIAPIILTLITILLIFFFARTIIGTWWALAPTIFFALSPTVLAHGHYVTTDIGATLGTLIAVFSFSSFLMFPTRKKFFISGICFGIAQLLKFSNVLLVPLFIIITIFAFIAEWYRNKKSRNNAYTPSKRMWFYAKSILGVFLVGGILVYGIYFIFTLNYPIDRQLSDTNSILDGFTVKFLKDIVIFFAGNSILRPIGEYLLGILMVMQRSAGGNTGYFLGEVTNTGWWHYFPVVFLTKETIPALLLVLFGILSAIRNSWSSIKQKRIIRAFTEYLGTHLYEFSMFLLVIIYWAWSIKSTLNIGIRHLLPIIPLMYILSVSSIKTWTVSTIKIPSTKKRRKHIKVPFGGILTISLACIITVQSIFIYPHFISFFNIFGGGAWNGFNTVTDSNYDWGQDLIRLKEWKTSLEKNDVAIGKIAIDYFGAGSPEHYLGNNYVERWWGSRGDPKKEGIEWIAVSINTLSQAFAKETNGFVRPQKNNYDWLGEIKTERMPGRANIPIPDARAGTSIFIYHL